MQLQTDKSTNWLHDSWKRSSDAGLRERRLPEEIRVARTQLSERRQIHAQLIEITEQYARPLFNQLFAKSDSRLILTDADGVVIASWGQKQFKSKLTTIALESGVCWKEDLKGTNAIGTAIVEQKPVSIIGDQHFIHQHRFISCSASPVFDHTGKLVAVLDITSEQQVHHDNTRHLIQTMVQKIEREMLCRLPEGMLRIDLATEHSVLQSGWQGILIADDNRNIIAHNQMASHLLRQESIVGQPVDHFLQQESDSLVFRLHNLSDNQAIKRATYSPASELHYGDERIEHAWQQGCKVINRQISLLILGETGVGKGEFVKALHRQSSRKSAPLVSVNCGALAKDLLESELFGYVGGAFTGANSKGYKGKIRQADKGILFLDEIADMPLEAQCRLLHVIQDKQVVPLGCNQSIEVDIQIIAATHKDLEQMVEQGLFRQDLYYRLNGLVVTLPPMRERKDKLTLIKTLHHKYASPDQSLCDELQQLLLSYHWPGNIRQLDNVIKVASLLAQDEEKLCLEHIPQHIAQHITSEQVGMSKDKETESSLKSTIDDALLTTYQANKGNISKTSKVLGVSRNTIYRKLKKIGVLK
ncbi:sigma-54-dependent Fis family transcriptional regulator [Vibrio sp. SCSIO 43137]|uniref:sigma-54-dependent Fis family transcriptional regulator n=1 Tax=Vibrio sp. SCSIO 43137 TaxID=3021011 RepID=UPI002306E21A|nr:sigma-54-dependent Fis family transcriptional regulator [Vibrio sp. SCSIO 43137]WCE30867.1 sigma-54-dependent Fis family transcriptional regulator [Vibrio sp. SCSIO 43137]